MQELNKSTKKSDLIDLSSYPLSQKNSPDATKNELMHTVAIKTFNKKRAMEQNEPESLGKKIISFFSNLFHPLTQLFQRWLNDSPSHNSDSSSYIDFDAAL